MSYKMSGIVEVPVETVDDNVLTEPVEAIQEEVVAAKPKPKMGRPTGKKDAKPRAKPKPKAKAVQERVVELARPESESSSEDEASLHELHTLRMMRAVRSFDQSRMQRKQDKYASWFGR